MTTKDALRAYNQIAGAVFCKANQKWSFQDGAFKVTTLEERIQDFVAAKELGECILRENGEAKFAKTFVCAVPAANMAHPRLFRSYVVRENANTNYFILDLVEMASVWSGRSWIDRSIDQSQKALPLKLMPASREKTRLPGRGGGVKYVGKIISCTSRPDTKRMNS